MKKSFMNGKTFAKTKVKSLVSVSIVMKNLFLYCGLCFFISCTKSSHNPEFDKMNFTVDSNQHTLTVKSKWMGWSITGLNIDGKGINLDHNPANAKEMELDGLKLYIDYEVEIIETGEYENPKKISCEMFEITKPSSYKLIIKLERNTSQKDRLIKIGVGDVDYFGSIDITQKGS